MKLLLSILVMVVLVVVAVAVGLTGEKPGDYSPIITPSDFVSVVDNEFFPLTPGTVYTFEGVSADGNEHNEVNVTNETKVILGVTCVVVRDIVWVNGEVAESTLDWYAQDKHGNVWYFGEDSKEYSGGVVVSTEGSWEAGVDGAKPGIVMKGNPVVGETYRQEYLKGEAEDMAEAVATNVSVTITYGSFTGCLQTKDWTPLEKGVAENKYFAPGIGLLLEQMVEGGTDRMELVSIVAAP
jgi:hypothetical protein